MISLCHYLTGRDVEWTEDNYRARALVKSFKNDEFGGTQWYTIGGKKYRITKHNREELVTAVVPILARKLRQEVSTAVSLVPIPNSSATIADRVEFRTANVAKRIANAAGPTVAAVPALRWRSVRTASHKGSGHRRADHYIPQLSIVEVPRAPVVLFDDMCTSGSQMLASAHVLRNAGHTVLFGLVAGSRTEEQVDKPLNWSDFEVQQYLAAEAFEAF